MRTEEPATAEEAAELLAAAAADGRTVRFRGGGTKAEWGNPTPQADLELSTGGLARIVEHNAADLTAVVEAGVRLADAQAALAEAGQMLAVDPPLGPNGAATLGGVVATGDSGPLRHRYGGIRDLLLGMTVVLSDGSVAKSGGKVIKNVAGYDLAKLFAGSFGTLGLIVQVAVRLHPSSEGRVTARAQTEDPAALSQAAAALTRAPLEAECFDARWWVEEVARGELVMRCSGAAARPRADRAAALMHEAGMDVLDVGADDGVYPWSEPWPAQRATEGTIVRVSAVPSRLLDVTRTVERIQGSMVGRAGLGIFWIWIPELSLLATLAAIEDVRRALAPHPCVVLDAPPEVRERVDVWGPVDGSLDLMRRIKQRFDPTGTCNPGIFTGGI